MSNNQRQHPRQEIQIEVELNFLEDATRTVITRNMSLSGLFMTLDNTEHYPLGEMVGVRYKNPFENHEAIHKDAIIVRCTDEGIAIAYIEMEEF